MNKRFNHILIALVLIAYAFQGYGQEQRHVYSQHFLNPVLINPGATGFDDQYGILINYNNKWAGFDGGPNVLTLSYDGPVANRLSVGGLIFREQIGSLETIVGQLSYAYKIPADTYQISFGLTTEYMQYSLSGGDLNNPIVEFEDPLILQRIDGGRFFDVTAGVYGVFNDNIKFGLALPGLVRARLDDGPGESERTINYIAHLAYQYDVPNYDFYIEPSIFVKQLRNVPFHADINMKAAFMDEQLLGGVTYSLGYDRLGFLIGTRVNNFKLYYTYNVMLTDAQQYHNGIHEFTLGFDITGPNNGESNAN